MNQKTNNKGLTGTGAGEINLKRARAWGAVLAALGVVTAREAGSVAPAARRAATWSPGAGRFRVSSETRGARGGFDCAPSAGDGAASPRIAGGRAWASALVARSLGLLSLGGSVSVASVALCILSPAAIREGLRERWAREAAATREAVGVDLRAIRRAREAADGDGVPLGTVEAVQRRALDVSSWGESARATGGGWSSPAPVGGRLVMRPGRVGGLDRLVISRRSAQVNRWGWILSGAVAIADSQAGKLCKGGLHRAAWDNSERGGASGADDVSAYHQTREEIRVILREAAAATARNFAVSLEMEGFKLNKSARKALFRAVRRSGYKGGRGASDVAAWKYRAGARDGREVGGSWALQGAIAGLRDFSLSSLPGWDVEAEDMEAGAESVDSVIEEGDSLSDLGAVVVGGLLPSRPDSGAGSGMRPGFRASVVEDLQGWASGMRASFAEHVARATKGQAAAKARIAAGESMDVIAGLLRFAEGGESGINPRWINEFFELGKRGETVLSQTGRDRLRNLRKRGGLAV